MEKKEVSIADQLSQKEKEFFNEMKDKLHKLVDDLKDQGMIKRPQGEQLERFLKINKIKDDNTLIYNSLINIVGNENQQESLECLEKIGITKENFPLMIGSMIIANFNKETEMFKLALLLMLKRERGIRDKITFGPLCDKIKSISNLADDVLNKFDLDLRNAFSHQTHWFNEGKLYYCKDSTLEHPSELSLGELMLKGKRQNIVYLAFLTVFGEKANTGFFNDCG